MKIDCYLSVGCASEGGLRTNLSEALDLEGIRADVSFTRIGEEEAQKRGLKGSPTVLIDGADPFPSDTSGFS